MEKTFENYTRNDGIRSKHSDTNLTLDDAVEIVVERVNDVIKNEIKTKLESLNLGDEHCYLNGIWTQNFIKRTK